MFRFITTAFAVAALLTSVIPVASAMEPLPQVYLLDANINAQAIRASGQYSDLGHLVPSQYVLVRVTGLTQDATITIGGFDGTKEVYRTAKYPKVQDGKHFELLDFGTTLNPDAVTNPDADAPMIAAWYSGFSQTNVTVELWALPNVSTTR